jgi:23S rRNA pseudouridine2605 synthase
VRNGRRPQQAKGARRDADTPDDVFSFVTSKRLMPDVTEDDKSRAGAQRKPVRRDLTADDDAPKLHKVLRRRVLARVVIWKI